MPDRTADYRARLIERIGLDAYRARRAAEMRRYRGDDVPTGVSARIYADEREKAREKKRRARARRRAKGLNAAGKPLKRPDLVDAGRIGAGLCPDGCICVDCLFPPQPWVPRVIRTAGGSFSAVLAVHEADLVESTFRRERE